MTEYAILPGARDELFVSDRDRQPFVVRYGAGIRGMSATRAPLIAYEREGKNGRHLVAYANLKAEEVGAQRLQELLADGP